jgi:formylglycine-generating enzyme required for sulfatase activity
MSCCGATAMIRPDAGTWSAPRAARSKVLDSSGMAHIPGGPFLMGSESPDTFIDDGEGPVREVQVSPYLIDTTAVTNAAFAEFVAATGHVTDAEREGWSFVFHALLHPQARSAVREGAVPDAPWWLAVERAGWQAPEGPGSNIDTRANHPVVHVSWHDASAFAAWCGKRLPSEAEWERAARGGLVQAPYPWGDELRPAGQHRCNLWQGRFPDLDTGDDGYIGTCPVDTFEPNGFGLYNMSGNVWEWCADRWSPDALPGAEPAHLIRGGSYLCHASYCNRYRVSARHHNHPASTAGHMGFRCAADAR